MNAPDPHRIESLIYKAIVAKIEEAIQAEVQNVSKAVEKRVRESVGQIAANVCSRMSYEQFGTQLKITVDFGDRK